MNLQFHKEGEGKGREYICLLVVLSVFLMCTACLWFLLSFMMIYLLTAVGLTPGGSSTVHIYTQTIHRATQ